MSSINVTSVLPKPDFSGEDKRLDFKENKNFIYCPSCREKVNPSKKYHPGVVSWVICLFCVLFGCFFGCCLIHFCLRKVQDRYHHCSKCNNFISKNFI